jgi:hypothetical protein
LVAKATRLPQGHLHFVTVRSARLSFGLFFFLAFLFPANGQLTTDLFIPAVIQRSSSIKKPSFFIENLEAALLPSNFPTFAPSHPMISSSVGLLVAEATRLAPLGCLLSLLPRPMLSAPCATLSRQVF